MSALHPRPVWACLALLVLLLASPLRAAEADADTRLALRTAAALYEGIRTETLDNGLRVFLKPIPGSAAVTTLVVYKVGSADEDLTHTGLAHYLEHLMFKGTARLKPGDIDRLTFRHGGSNNAYTSTDLTAYHFTMPAGQWRPALQVEADRMRQLRIDKEHEFDKEKGAVINELTGNEDEPWTLEYKAILPPLFGRKAPYGHPVIGEARDVRAATAAVIKGFYDRWYHPNNAALVLVGGFDADEASAAIKKLFGPIPRAELPPRKPLPEVKLERPARRQMKSKFTVARLLQGYNTVRRSDPDYYALNVVETLLGRGRTSRLYKALVEGAEIARTATADHTAGRYPGWLAVQVEMLPGKDRALAEKLVLKELARLGEEEVSAAELKRARHLILADHIFNRESTGGLANAIGQGVATNDLAFVKGYLPRIVAVSAADVRRVARKYLAPERRVVLWSVPEKAKGAAAVRVAGGRGLVARKKVSSLASRVAASGAAAAFDLRKTKRVVLPNGLVLLLFENRRLPTFEAHALVHDAGLHQPDDKLGVAALTGYLLEEGTKRRSGPQVAEAIENVGGTLSLGSFGGSVKVLLADRRLGLQLLLECLSQPSFPKEAFGRNKARLLAGIAEIEAQPDTRAERLFNRLVYGKNPLGRPSSGTKETASKLTLADCAAFHARVFVPNNTVLAVVGDFDAAALIEEVKRQTAGWKKSALERPEVPPVKLPRAFEQKILSMPQAAQLHVYLGHVGIKRNDPDYYRLLVLDYILGTGPGFTDRLSARLRDREGLAYTVSAGITTAAGRYPGTFSCYIGTDKDKLARVKKEIVEEIERIRDKPPSAGEVADVKAYLLGSRLLQFATNGGIASQLLEIERYGLGLNYLEEFRRAVQAVSAAEVQAAARKHLHPERMVLVAAGPVDGEGRPLEKGKEDGAVRER
jgi:zinc protease